VDVCGELKLELQGVGEIKAADLANRFNDSPPPDIMYVWSKPYIKLNKKARQQFVGNQTEGEQSVTYIQ